jgi:hypothetical protein
VYSADPLTLGAFSEEELQRITRLAALQTGLLLSRDGLLRDAEARTAALHATRERLSQADAQSGLPAAPLQWEVRTGLAHRFGRHVRGQVGHAYLRYLPTQGDAHVASTRWTVRLSQAWRVSAALSLQWDRLGEAPPQVGLLGTLGADLTF